MDRRLAGIAELFDGAQGEEGLMPLVVHDGLCSELSDMLQRSGQDILLRGSAGSGRRHLLRHALCKKKMRMIFADAGAVMERTDQAEKLLWLICREALLADCGVCFYGLTAELLKTAADVGKLLQSLALFRREQVLLVFCADRGLELLPYLDRGVGMLDVPDVTRQERIQLWQCYLEHYSLDDDPVMLGSKYRLTPAEISRASMQLAAQPVVKGADASEAERRMQEVMQRLLPKVTAGTIEPPHPNCTADELVLPAQTMETIQRICDHVRFSHQVYDTWNMESRFAYGKAVSVLMYGPPGTGKTMTARVICDLLGLPLYHVNLSQVADKYIGETEKHLEEIFANAEKSNLILFFDEADAVFSKRSQISDAKDKHANTEVSYILQRLESYDGIVLLATNFLNNIDPAFMRRMQYIITFYMPDASERKMLWQKTIPEECPADAIDFDFLAEQFEFSGSNIKNAVLAAAFYAAGTHETLGMKHLIYGVRNEFVKKGKPIFASEFGKYAYYIQQETDEDM